MFELMAVLLVVGVVWLFASVIGLVFKLVFGLLGALFGLVGALFGLLGGLVGVLLAGVLGLAMLPLALFLLVPLWLPLLCLIGFVWLVARASRKPAQQALPAGS